MLHNRKNLKVVVSEQFEKIKIVYYFRVFLKKVLKRKVLTPNKVISKAMIWVVTVKILVKIKCERFIQ